MDEQLLKAAHASLCIRWGTTDPYAIARVSAERVGYAQDPCVVVTVTCRDEDLSSLVPVTRQHVWHRPRSSQRSGRRCGMSEEWEAWFAALRRDRPLRLLELPLADFECAVCGQLGCAVDHESEEK
jgi:hypothetical protein